MKDNTLTQLLQRHWVLLFCTLICAIFMVQAIGIVPTYDDWSTLSSPNFDPFWHKFFMPYGSVWRPIDALMGYVSQDATQFPLYNHIITVAAHYLSTLMVYALSRRFFTKNAAAHFATIIFCMSPCMLATVFACDAINQSLSQMFGLAAATAFIFMRSRWRYVLWAVLVWTAALAKDNGIAWAVVPPVLALFVERTPMRTLCRRLAFGVAIAIVYAAVRLSLPFTIMPNPEYSTFSLTTKALKTAMLMAYSFFPVDWLSVFCVKARHIVALILTAYLSLRMWFILFPGVRRAATMRQTWVIVACFIIVLSPNLLISMSMMNMYAGLAFAALLTGMAAEQCNDKKNSVYAALIFFVTAAALTDLHHIQEATDTAQTGIVMAENVNDECLGHKQTDRVFSVTIAETERKFSSFHVLPSDAFSNGQALLWLNNYRWPLRITEEHVTAGERKKAEQMARKAVEKDGFAYAFIVEHDKVEVIKAPKK